MSRNRWFQMSRLAPLAALVLALPLTRCASTTAALAEGGVDVGTFGLTSDGPDLRYYSPCSVGPGAKTYSFTLYALSAAPTFAVPAAQVSGPVVTSAIAGLVLDSSRVNVSYTR